MRTGQGSISLFLALILIPVLILVMTLAESVRCCGLKVNVLEAGHAASDSVLAGFDRSVFEKYGLLFYDGGFGLGLTQYDQIEDEYETYFNKNISSSGLLAGGSFFGIRDSSATVTDIIHATDYQGMVFVTSALDYYKFDKAGDILADILDKLGLIQKGEQAKEESDEGTAQGPQAARPKAAVQKEAGLLLRESPMEEQPATDEETYDDILTSSIIGQSREARVRGWINLAFPKNRTLSGYRIIKDDLPSVTAVDERDDVSGNIFTNALKKVAFDEYLLDYFTCFMDEEERTGLQYELEYILFGEETDDANMKKTLNRLLLIREGMNLLSMAGCATYKAEAKTLATLMVGWTGLEPLVALTALLIEAAWSHAESISDVKGLLSGERIPLLKKEEDWRLSLSNVGAFFSGNGAAEKTSTEGMNYKDYLRILLYLTNFQDTAYRAMDMVQHNEQKNGRVYLMASQIYALEFRVFVWAGQVFTGLPFVRKELGLGSDYFFIQYFSGAY